MTAAVLTSCPTPAEREALILDNQGVVHAIVWQIGGHLPAHVDRDDLTSAGMVGLVLSARSFDPARGVPFHRWAAIRIRGEITDELRRMDWASRSVRTRARQIEAARNHLAPSLGRSARPDEVAAALGMDVAEVLAVDADVHSASLLSLDRFTGDVLDTVLADHEVDDPDGPLQAVLAKERAAQLLAALAELPDRHRMVFEAAVIHECPYAPIAAAFGVTESRISQIRKDVLAQLRTSLAAYAAGGG